MTIEAAGGQVIPFDHLQPMLMVLGWVMAFVAVIAQWRLAVMFSRLWKIRHGQELEADSEAPSALGIFGGLIMTVLSVVIATSLLVISL